MASSSSRLVTSSRCRGDLGAKVLETSHRWRGSMFDRVAILAATPSTSFLTLLFELLLSFGICKAEIELDAIVLDLCAVKLFDDSFSNLTTLEPRAC